MDELLNHVHELIRLQKGDLGRLEHIKNTLENNRTLYTSDIQYVEGLVQKHLLSTNESQPDLENTSQVRVNNVSETVFCWKCGSALQADQNFCPKCGVSKTQKSEQRSGHKLSKSSDNFTTSLYVGFLGAVVLFFGIIIMVWSLTLPMILAGQYMILGILVLVIGGVIVFGARRIRTKNV